MENANRFPSRRLRLVVIENGADGIDGFLPSHDAQETVMIAGVGYDLTTQAIRRLDALARQGRRVCGVVVAVAGHRGEQAEVARSALLRSVVLRMSGAGGGTLTVLVSRGAHPATRSQLMKVVDTLLAEVKPSNVHLQLQLDPRRSVSPVSIKAAS